MVQSKQQKKSQRSKVFRGLMCIKSTEGYSLSFASRDQRDSWSEAGEQPTAHTSCFGLKFWKERRPQICWSTSKQSSSITTLDGRRRSRGNRDKREPQGGGAGTEVSASQLVGAMWRWYQVECAGEGAGEGSGFPHPDRKHPNKMWSCCKDSISTGNPTNLCWRPLNLICEYPWVFVLAPDYLCCKKASLWFNWAVSTHFLSVLASSFPVIIGASLAISEMLGQFWNTDIFISCFCRLLGAQFIQACPWDQQCQQNWVGPRNWWHPLENDFLVKSCKLQQFPQNPEKILQIPHYNCVLLLCKRKVKTQPCCRKARFCQLSQFVPFLLDLTPALVTLLWPLDMLHHIVNVSLPKSSHLLSNAIRFHQEQNRRGDGSMTLIMTMYTGDRERRAQKEAESKG